MNMRFFVSGAVALAFASASPARALDTKPVLSLDLAKKLAEGCEAKAKADNLRMNVAVVNDGGRLVYFEHMDGSYLGSIAIAQEKANTSASFPAPSRFIGELAFGKDGKPGMAPGLAFVPGLATIPGGLPIMTANKIPIGAIGVSGGTSDQDEACAQAALAAVADDLK